MHAHNTKSLVEKLSELPPERVAEVEDFIDFLRSRQKAKSVAEFPVIRVGQWPEGISLRREDIYGDEGR
jgi:hypothetical protein